MITRVAHWCHGAFSCAKDAYEELDVVHFVAAVLISVILISVAALSIARRRTRRRQAYVHSTNKPADGTVVRSLSKRTIAWLEQEERDWNGKRNRRRLVYVFAFLSSVYVVYRFAITWSRLSEQRRTESGNEVGGGGWIRRGSQVRESRYRNQHVQHRGDDHELVSSSSSSSASSSASAPATSSLHPMTGMQARPTPTDTPRRNDFKTTTPDKTDKRSDTTGGKSSLSRIMRYISGGDGEPCF